MTDATTCPDCTESARQLWHGFRAGCKGCEARSLSRSPQFFAARLRGMLTEDYRRALSTAGLKHEEVKAAAMTDFGGS